MTKANKKASAKAQKDANNDKILRELKRLKAENENLKVAFSKATENASRIKTQKEKSDYFLTKKEEVFIFNNLNEVAKTIENNAESYLKILQKRLNKEKFTSKEFKVQLAIDLNKVTE